MQCIENVFVNRGDHMTVIDDILFNDTGCVGRVGGRRPGIECNIRRQVHACVVASHAFGSLNFGEY